MGEDSTPAFAAFCHGIVSIIASTSSFVRSKQVRLGTVLRLQDACGTSYHREFLEAAGFSLCELGVLGASRATHPASALLRNQVTRGPADTASRLNIRSRPTNPGHINHHENEYYSKIAHVALIRLLLGPFSAFRVAFMSEQKKVRFKL